MFFTLSPQPHVSNLDILAKCFQKNILVLNYYDLQSLSTSKLLSLRESVQKSIQENFIELVVIDITGDPEKIENPDSLVTIKQLASNFSTLTNTVIVTEDFDYYYRPFDGIVYFPYGLWIVATKSVHLYYWYKDTAYDTTLEKTQPIMCFNRNLVWHRLYLFSLLANKSWFDKIKYSFINKLGDRLDSYYGIKRFLTVDEIEAIRLCGHLLPIQVEEEKSKNIKDIPIMYNRGATSVNDPTHTNTAINLVTETSLTEGVVLTEKTAKPFMAYQIPILVGPVGANQFLEDIGLDMFSDYIPWKTWDHIEDHKLKIRMIVEFLDSLLSSPTAEQNILSAHQQFHARLIRNKEYFHSIEFENILLKQFKSYTN
jgi:hypothetical protein